MSTYMLWQARPVKAAMHEDLWLIPLTNTPPPAPPFLLHTRCAEAAMLISPGRE